MVTINGKEFGNVKFPNGETQYKGDQDLECDDTYCVSMKYEDDSDIVKLIMAKKYIDDIPTLTPPYCFLELHYVPYSRMDRKTQSGELPTIKYLAQIINALNFNEVRISDPHSDVTSVLINKCRQEDLGSLFIDIIDTFPDYIFYPDAGAYKRYSAELDLGIPSFFGNKHRDTNTGKLSNFQLVDPPDLNNKRVLIVDDICAKGNTAYGFAKLIKRCGAKQVDFYVTHCEPAIFEGNILKDDVINKVYTTDSIIRPKSDKIIQRRIVWGIEPENGKIKL